MNRRWANAFTVFSSVAVSLLLAEGALRLVGVRFPAFYTVDAERGYALRPGAAGRWTREGSGHVRVNSAGFRAPEVSFQPPARVLRVAVLGDSFTEALQVDEQDTWIRQLQDRLNVDSRCKLVSGFAGGVQILNFGVGGYGTGQQLLTWRHLASRYKPNLVILAVYPGNDFIDNEPTARPDRPVFRLAGDSELQLDNSFQHKPVIRWRLSPPGQLVESLVSDSRVLQLLNEAKNRLAAQSAALPASPSVSPLSPPHASEEAWQITDALIGKLDQEVSAQGSRLVVVSTSSPDQVWPRNSERPPKPFAQEQRLAGLLAVRRIPYLPLGPLLQHKVDQSHVFLHGFRGQALGDGHWNEAGHALAASAIAPWLCGL